MLITIFYDRLFSDGSLMERDNYQFKSSDFDLSIIPDVIAIFYKSCDNKGINIKITHIIIDREGYEDDIYF